MDKQKVTLLLIFLFALLAVVSHIETSSLPVNRLVRDALRRQQREALAESENSEDDSEDGGETTGSSTTTESASVTSPASSSSAPKPRNSTKIDWNEIEKTWYEWKEDAEITKKWDDMEKGMKKGKCHKADPICIERLA